MKRTRLRLLTGALVLFAVPVNAATEIVMPLNSGRKGSTVVAPLNDSYTDIVNAANTAEGVAARTATITDLEPLPLPISLPGYAPPVLAAPADIAGLSPVVVAGQPNLLPYAGLAGLLILPFLLGSGGDGSFGSGSGGLVTAPGSDLGPGPGAGPGAGPGPGPGPGPSVPGPSMPGEGGSSEIPDGTAGETPGETPGNPEENPGPPAPPPPDLPVSPPIAPLPAVPEPATWLMLLLGFAALGSASRTSRTRRPEHGHRAAHATG